MKSKNPLSMQLEIVLEREYAALLNGNIDALEDLSAQKQTILETIAALPASDLLRFEGFRARLIRNQMLSQSAIDGMRAAIERVREVSEITAGLKTYHNDGRTRSVSMASGAALSKRS